MNKLITKLYPSKNFRVFFEPDKEQENFVVGMEFKVIAVNRKTGEVQFALEYGELVPND